MGSIFMEDDHYKVWLGYNQYKFREYAATVKSVLGINQSGFGKEEERI